MAKVAKKAGEEYQKLRMATSHELAGDPPAPIGRISSKLTQFVRSAEPFLLFHFVGV
jgi:hypothetical protein